MDASPARHPTDQTLSSFGLGKLDDRSTRSVNEHLMECGDCRRRVAEMSADSFLGRIRDARNGPDRSQTGGTHHGTSANVAAPPTAGTDTLPPGLADHPDYEIKRELGRGGMGVVYLAHNTLMGRLEVLKVVGGHLVNRFLREIRSAAKLQHPNIVTAYSAMRLGEGVVLAMEFVDGLDLSKMVRTKGPLPVGHACYFIHQVALGLQHAHERAMVHRDIKPANLILAREGKKAVVKILDFGLAKITSEGQVDSGLTREGQMLGTPDYIAPEQIRDAQGADIRADIYSLGCTFYYLLTGGPPFRAENIWDLYQAHFSMDASPLNLVRPEVPAELAALVAKMMAKEPQKRFQTPGTIARELTRFFKPATAPGLATASAGPVAEMPHVAPPLPPTQVSGVGSAPMPAPAPPQSPPTRRLVTIPPDSRPAKPDADGVSWESLIEFKATEPALTPSKTRPAPATASGPERRPPWRSGPIIAIAAAALAGLVALGVIIHITTDKGRTTITVDEKTGDVLVEKEPVPDSPATTAEGQQAGWVSLFNRKDLTGWMTHPTQPGDWRVEEGILIGSGPRAEGNESHLYSDRGDYRDFHLRVVARINGGGNSGIMFRASYGPFWPGDRPRFPLGYEAQINSTHPDQNKTGSLLYGGLDAALVSVTRSEHYPDGWFTLEIIARGNHFITRVNGKTTADYTDTERQSPGGRIALQQLNPSTTVEFRTIEIQELNGDDREIVDLSSASKGALGDLPPRVSAPGLDTRFPGAEGGLGDLPPRVNATRAPGVGKPSWPPSITNSGAWSVEGDEVVQSLIEPRPGEDPWYYLVFGDPAWSDYDLTLQAKRTDGIDALGVLFHWTSRGDNLALNLGGYGNKGYELRSESNGSWGRAERNYLWKSIETDRWYAIKVMVRKASVQCYVNGELLFGDTDPRFTSGRIGLACYHTSARFRSIRVTDPRGNVLWEGLPVPATSGSEEVGGLGPPESHTIGTKELNKTDDDANGLSSIANRFLDPFLFGKPPGTSTAKKPGDRRPGPQRPADARKFLGKYYKVFPQQLTWHDARVKCQELGGHLAIVANEKVNQFLIYLMSNHGIASAWLGATDEKAEGRWVWVDGNPMQYSNWSPVGKQPNNKRGLEHYSVIWLAHDGKWSDQPNQSTELHPGFICQWD